VLHLKNLAFLGSGALTRFSEDFHKKIVYPDGVQQRPALVTTEGDEMQVAVSVTTFGFSRHVRKEPSNLLPRRKKEKTVTLYYCTVN
jgi:hypothetical protein